MRSSLLALVPLTLNLFLACGDGSDSATGPSGGGSLLDIAGRYDYESLATTMACSGGLSVPLPAVTDVLTITQDRNRFDGELDVAASVGAPADATFFDECILANGGAYTCTGEYRDSNAVITYSGGGQFTATGFNGSMNLRMTLADGTVCTWTKQERGTKIG